MSLATWQVLSGRLAALGASTLELAAIQASYFAMTTATQGALDTLTASLANADLLVMLNTWRTSGSPFHAGLPGGGLPFGTGVAVLTGNAADDTSAISAGTGVRLASVPAGNPSSATKTFYAALPPYNVKADGKTVTDAAIASGSNQLSSASAAFKPNQLVVVVGAGTPASGTTSGSVSGSITSIPVNALASAILPGGITLSGGGHTQRFVTSGALAGATSIPLIGPAVTNTSAALSTGGAITSIPVPALDAAVPSGTVTLVYIATAGAVQTQTFATAGAAVGATSIPVTSQTPNFAYPASAYVLGNPVAVTANATYASASTVQADAPALSTTILSVAGGVATLAASAGTTVASGGECFYATNDTTGWQSCINDAAAVGGTVVGPDGDSAINAALTESTALGILGQGVKDLYGATGTIGVGGINQAAFPSVAPYLEGSVIVQCALNTDILQSTVQGSAFHLEKIGLRFAGRYVQTGHAVNSTPVGSVLGNTGGNWRDVHVFGVDGNHQGFLPVAVLNMQHTGLRVYGGGGMRMWNGSVPGQPGNVTSLDCFYNCYIGGIAHALHIDGSGPGANWSACDFHNVDPQVNAPNPVLAGVPVPTSAQQITQTTNGGGMVEMTWGPSAAQSQIAGSNVRYPWGVACFRANAPTNATISNPVPTNAPATATAIQNQYGSGLWATITFQTLPTATGSPSTTLSGVITSGTVNLPVASSTGFSVGQTVQIGDASHDGNALDFGIVSNVPDGTHVTISNPGSFGVAYAHSSGATVQVGPGVVFAQIASTSTFPGNLRPIYLGAPIAQATDYKVVKFYIPSGWWYRLDFAKATVVWITYTPQTLS